MRLRYPAVGCGTIRAPICRKVPITKSCSLRLGRWVPLLALLVSGCVTHTLATRIVKAPNQQQVSEQSRQLAKDAAPLLQLWRVPVGPPKAEIAVGVLEPGDYHFTYKIKETVSPDGESGKVEFNFDFKPRQPRGDSLPRGTLVLLHGVMMNKESMILPWGIYFAQQGYRVVLVDLRGHGASTGKWIGFGAWEPADLMKVTDELQRRHLLAGRMGVFGVSYGAAVAIQWAARDSRAAALVALAPFSDPQRAIVSFARGYDTNVAGKLSDVTFAAAEVAAAKMAGFAWNEADVLAAAKSLRVPVLFYHGQHDDWIPPVNTEQLAAVAPMGSRRIVLPHDNHMSLMMRVEPIGAEALAWFDERLAEKTAAGSTAMRTLDAR